MRRLHLFEWEDQPWLPSVFRDFITDHLRFGLSEPMRRSLNRSIAKHLKGVFGKVETRRIVDLCSGAGGPLLEVQQILTKNLKIPVEVLLTDLYPNKEAFERSEADGGGAVKARYESTSAFDVPEELTGVRTLFTALHHFRPEQVKLILADAAKKRQPIATFEPLERSWRMLTVILLDAIRRSIFLTPKVGKLTPARFIFTYLIPIAPMIMMWDGAVSVMRTYKPEELRQLAEEVGATEYDWEAGQFDHLGPYAIMMPTIYLIGCPRTAGESVEGGR
ncbi:MAG: hypothetical protein U0903_02575 [Planctomycetales bacterium]